ncbi:hypothetical protein [Hyphococcus sp.]|jgi:hypothetical protein|uniref:hypothetical protein n=1 Tax=Hyphococcus sp. TaxID=2038636 RepID=UPI003D14E6D8
MDRTAFKAMALAACAAVIAACGDRGGDEELTTAVEPAPEEIPSAAETVSGEWFYKESNGYPWAGFGPPRSEAMFVVACRQGQVMFQHAHNEDEVISIQLAEGRQEIPMEANQGELPMTEGALPANHPFVRLILDTQKPIRVVSPGGGMTLPNDTAYRRVIRACMGDGA